MGGGTLAYNPSDTVPSAVTASGTGTSAVPPINPGDTPRALRDGAYAECGKTHWRRCLELLDLAKKGDIEGDRDAQVQATRALVSQMLARDGG